MSGSGLIIQLKGSMISPFRSRYTGIAARTDAFRSKHAQAVSTRSSMCVCQFGVDQPAGQPDHGDGDGNGNDRENVSSPSSTKPSGSPGRQSGSDTVPGGGAGSLAFGVMPLWSPRSLDQKPIALPSVDRRHPRVQRTPQG